MSHHPTHVGSGPVHISGRHVVDGLHTPLECHDTPASVTYHAFGLASGARGVEDIERIIRIDGHTFNRLGLVHHLQPVQVAPLNHLSTEHRALQNNAVLRLMLSQLDRMI